MKEKEAANPIQVMLKRIHCHVRIFAWLVSSQSTKLSSLPTSWSRLAPGWTISVRYFGGKVGVKCHDCLFVEPGPGALCKHQYLR